MNTFLRCCFHAVLISFLFLSISYAQIPVWKKVFDGQGISIGINPYNSNTIYAQGNDNRLNVSRDGGATWTTINTSIPYQTREIIVHPNDTSTIFVVNFSDGLYRSTDGGNSFSLVLNNYGIDGESVVYDQLHPDTTYAGNFGDAAVFRSTDRGTTWTLQGHAGSSGNLCGLVVRPDSANILYAGTGAGTISKSTDAGISWKQVKSGGSQEIPKMVVDPRNPQVAYAAAFAGNVGSTGIWKTSDGGEHWGLTSLQSISMWSLDMDYNHPDTIYSGTFSESGTAVYRSTDAGSTWTKIGVGYAPYNSLWNLKVDRQNGANVYVAATVGDFNPNGIFKLVNANTGIQGYIIDSLTSQILTSGTVQIAPTGESYDLSQTNGFYSTVRYDNDTTTSRSFSVYINSVLFHQQTVGFINDSILTKNLAVQPGTISGTLFNDLNNNGIQDGGEGGLSGWVIRVDGGGTFTSATDVNGHYSFPDLFPGTYIVSEEGNFGWQKTSPVESTYSLTINLSAKNFTAQNFGNHAGHRVISVFPSPYGTSIAANTIIQATFDTVVDPVTIHDTSTAIVRGSSSGIHRCAVTFNGTNTTLTMTPAFFSGEVVSVDITGKVKAANGGAFTPHCWQFTIGSFSSNGTFGPKTEYTVGNQPWGIAAGDLDHDGTIDIVTANMTGNSVSVLKNRGDGTFFPKVDYGVGLAPLAIELADVDNNGNLDIVVANSGSSSVTVLKNDGAGNFPTRIDYPTEGSPSSVSVGDLHGNGTSDIIVTLPTNYAIAVLPDTGQGFGQVSMFSAGVFPWSATIADINGDGGNDVTLVGSLSSSSLGILQNVGSGKIAPPVSYPLGGYSRGIVVADFNNDGKPDVVATNSTDNTFTFSPQNLSGTFSSPITVSTDAQPWAIAAADVNGDGYTDVCVTNVSANRLSVYLNNGGLTFTQKDYTTTSQPRALVVADLNGDKNLDIVVANSGGNTISVFLNILSLPVSAGWNMISVPTNITKLQKSSVYPTSVSPAFLYQNGYTPVDTLSSGYGYWVKFDTATTVDYPGISLLSDSVHLNPGWNLIGGIGVPINVANLTTQPPDIIASNYYSYDGSYQVSSTLEPGSAYWVRSSGSGSLIMTSSQSSRTVVANEPLQSSGNVNSIEFTDARNKHQTLYFESSQQSLSPHVSTELPPRPPDGAFDVRFDSNDMLVTPDKGKASTFPVHLQAADFPVKIRWQIQEAGNYRWNLLVNDVEYPLVGSGMIVV
jgi:photosystem II stability/assembly factor-like uncharacterized protein